MSSKVVFGFMFLLLAFGSIITFQYFKFNDGKLHVVFCDVGQGDGIFIRTPSEKNILVDAGPDDKIVTCIEDHTPFWDRTISFVFLTHPHADHFTGFKTVIEKYNISNFAAENIQNDTVGYKNLLKQIAGQGLRINYVYSGDRIKADQNFGLLVLGPTKEFLSEVSPEHLINKSSEQATLDILLTYKNFDVILTGDTQDRQLLDDINRFDLKNVEILKVPHHGSRTGLNSEILQRLDPKYAVISVGAKNRYGHPKQFTLDLLKSAGIPILRTDQEGTIEFVSDGESFSRAN